MMNSYLSMVVTCEKCTTRYQLPDDKIRPSGTKVRCPRCQHTFRVFPKSEPVEANPQATVPQQRPVSQKPAPPAPPPANKREKFSEFRSQIDSRYSPDSDATEFVERTKKAFTPPTFEEDQNTRVVSDDEEKTLRQKSKARLETKEEETPTPQRPSPFTARSSAPKPKIESPFKNTRPSAPEGAPAAPSLNEAMKGEDIEARPFGDATFAAIQESIKPVGSSRRKIMVASFVFVLAGLIFFAVKEVMQRQPQEVAIPVVAPQSPKILVYRPETWYREDLKAIQSTLAMLAGLPENEREKPEYRATLAEALVLNGVLNSSNDQIASGLNLASRLVASDPQGVYGLYALAANAFYKNDLETLADLRGRWPSGNRGDPEYRLTEIISLKSSGQPELAFTRLKELLTDYPDFFRAQLAVLQFSTEFPDIADQIVGSRKLNILKSSFDRYQSNLKQMAGLVPNFHKELGQRLERTQEPLKKSEDRPKETPPETKPSREEKSESIDKPAPAAEKPAARPPSSTRSETARKGRKALPKQSEDLVAANRQTRREQSEAEKLLDKGNDLFTQKKFDEAMTAYNQALRLNPDLAEAYRQMGVIYMNTKQQDRALVSFKIYLQLKPDSADKKTVEGWISSLR